MYNLMHEGIAIAEYATLQACQAVATASQYCVWVG